MTTIDGEKLRDFEVGMERVAKAAEKAGAALADCAEAWRQHVAQMRQRWAGAAEKVVTAAILDSGPMVDRIL